MSEISVEPEIRDQPRVSPRAKLEVSRLGFAPFVFVNILLFIRPGELFPFVAELHLYEISILLCLALYWPRIAVAFRWDRLIQSPITVCVAALLPITVLSLIWNGRMGVLAIYAVEFLKVVLYYLILVVAIDNAARLRIFVQTLAVIIMVVGGIALGHFFNVFQIDTIQTLLDKRTVAVEGMQFAMRDVTMTRLIGVGIFNDPNDLAQILAVGVVLAVYGFELSRWAVTKALWVVPMLIMLAGIYYTHSRGGLLAMMAGLGILFMARFGVKKAAIVGVLAMVPMLYLFGGHQTTMSTEDDSTQARVQLWSDSMQALRENMLFGLGPDGMNDYSGQVSHNSFLSAFAETGVLGGFLFLTAYGVAIWGLLRLRLGNTKVVSPDLAKLTPVLAAAIVAYAVGMMSLTRNYVIPTYMILGLAAVYMRIVRTEPEKPPLVVGLGLLGKSFALSVLFLLAMQIFVKAFVRWG